MATNSTPIASSWGLIASLSRMRMFVQIANNRFAKLCLDYRTMPTCVNGFPFLEIGQTNAVFSCVVITNAIYCVRFVGVPQTYTRMNIEIFSRIDCWLAGLNFVNKREDHDKDRDV